MHHDVTQSAIPSPGYVGYNEVPATDNKPPRNNSLDVNSLIHYIFHSNYPEFSKPKPPTRRFH